MRRIILMVLAIILPMRALGFWSVYEVPLEELQKRPWIIVYATTNEATTHFIVVFDYEKNERLSLEIQDEKDSTISDTAIRGEAIHLLKFQEMARVLGFEAVWKKGRANVYQFTVNSQLLKKSKLTWEFKGSADDFWDMDTGGHAEWSYLSTLAQANRNAIKSRTANGSPPIRTETNRTQSAAGSTR
jgi:hypothetical protein